MKKQLFQTLVSQRKKLKIKKKPPIAPKWLEPINQEKNYNRILNNLTKEIIYLIKKYLYPELPSLIEEVKQKTPNDRLDSFLDRFRGIIIHIGNALKDTVNLTINQMRGIGNEISLFNKKQAQKLNHSIFGFDIFVDEPWLADQLQLFSVQNAQLITSIPEQELDRVAGIVERGLQQGVRHTELIKDIQKTFGITHRKARLIARDQTAKLNSSLTRLRQESVGVEEYIWQTSGDERVRPTHRANDGKKFRWDKPSPITGHPGHDVNCRCIARPVLDKLLNLGD